MQKSMKILFLTRLYWPHVGGVEKHVYSLSTSLSTRGHRVTVLTTQYDKKLKSREKRDGIQIIRFKQPGIKYLGLFYTWHWLLKNIDLIKESDIIHIHDVFIWYLPFRILFPRKPVYTTFHGRWGKYPIPFSDIIQKRLGAKLSKGVISIGEYIPRNYGFKSDITLYGAVNKVQNSKFKIQNDKSIHSASSGLMLSKVEASKFKIIYVGRLDNDIALDIVLEAFSKLSGYDFEFIGDGEKRKECEKYGKVHGFTDPTPFYKKAKFCFASGYLTIHEALANKCLVFVAYRHPLQRDYYKLTPFSKFIYSSDNPEKLAERLLYLNKNKKAAQKLIDAGYNWVKTQTWEKLTNSYLKLWGIKTT